MTKKWSLYWIIPIVCFLGFLGVRMYNKEHENVKDVTVTTSFSAASFAKAYANNEDSCNQLFLGKALAINGKVLSIEAKGDSTAVIYLGDDNESIKVSCTMDRRHLTQAALIKQGSVVTIKGFCTGFLMDVELNQCFVTD